MKMQILKAINHSKDYIFVAIITAFVVVHIYPLTVSHGSYNHGLGESCASNRAWWNPFGLSRSSKKLPGFRWPDLKHGMGDLVEEKKWFILPDGMNTHFALKAYWVGCTDEWCHILKQPEYGWMGNVMTFMRTDEDMASWLDVLKGYYGPLLHRIDHYVTSGVAVNLANVNHEARMFSLVTSYDYGPNSFLPPHYSREKLHDVGYLGQFLNWWHGKPAQNGNGSFSLGQALMGFLEAVFISLTAFFLTVNMVSIVGILIRGKTKKNHLDHSSCIPPVKLVNDDGITITLCFDPYNILAYGSYGKIQEVTQRGSSKSLVVKTVKKVDTSVSGVPPSDSLADLQTISWVDQIYVEKRILKLARGCPLLTHLLWAVENDVYMHFITPLHRGGDMKHFLEKHHHLNEEVIQFVTAEVICGLEFLHKNGIVHRDVKLDNIVIDGDGHIRLIDFGLAAENVFNSEKKLYDHCGSPFTMAPEILNDDIYNESCDWWAVGVVMFWMYTGEPPFDGSTEEEIFYKIRKEEPHWDESAGEKIKDCILWFLEKDPDFRLGMRGCPVGRIKDQAFFEDIDWELARTKELITPTALDMAPALFEIDQRENQRAERKSRAIKEQWFNMLNRQHLSTVSESDKQ